jgi:hypothetical protein
MVCVDLVGLFTIRTPAKTHSLLALTMIDPATHHKLVCHNNWLARYPRPQFIIIDNGVVGKFKHEFKQMCEVKIMALKPNKL